MSDIQNEPIKPNRDNQTLPTFDKVTLKYINQPIKPNNTDMPVNSDNSGKPMPDSNKPLPEIELFSHHNFNMLRNPPGEGDGIYGGEPLVSLRTTFDVNLAGHPLYQKVSSIIVYSGKWDIYAGDSLVATLGPGQYKEVFESGIVNDTITHFKSVL